MHWTFLRHLTQTVASPLFLTVGMLTAFYGYAWWRGVPMSKMLGLATASLFAFVDSQTIRPQDIVEPNLWPVAGVAVVLMWDGLRARSSSVCFAATVLFGAILWKALAESPLAAYRDHIAVHLVWVSAIALGLGMRDRFSTMLKGLGALMMPAAALLVADGPWTGDLPGVWRGVYVAGLAVASVLIAQRWHSRWYLYAFTSLLALMAYGVALQGYRGTTSVIGRAATIAIGWSVATLLTAFLISAHKAGWLPKRLFPRWPNGHAPPSEATVTSPS